jgi:hypothetical protein
VNGCEVLEERMVLLDLLLDEFVFILNVDDLERLESFAAELWAYAFDDNP